MAPRWHRRGSPRNVLGTALATTAAVALTVAATIASCASPAVATPPGSPTGPPTPARVDLFVPTGWGTEYACFRQPIVVVAGSQDPNSNVTVLAFAEGRNNTFCAGTHDGYPMRLVLRRSVTTAAAHAAAALSDDSAWGAYELLRTGGMDFYVGAWEPASSGTGLGVVHLLIQDTDHAGVLYYTSADHGATWSDATILSIAGASDYTHIGPSVGHGITVSPNMCPSAPGGKCSGSGNVVVPFVCNTKSASVAPDALSLRGDHGICPTCHSCVVTGVRSASGVGELGNISWTVGGAAQSGSRESEAVQVWSNSTAIAAPALLLNERNFGTSPGHRMVEWSLDGGATYTGGHVDSTLPTPITGNWTGIVGGFSRLSVGPAPAASAHATHTAGDRNRLVFASASAATTRADMTVRLSYDEGATWATSKVLHSGPAGYADIAAVSPAAAGIIFENGDAGGTFADRISFSMLPLAWLEAA